MNESAGVNQRWFNAYFPGIKMEVGDEFKVVYDVKAKFATEGTPQRKVVNFISAGSGSYAYVPTNQNPSATTEWNTFEGSMTLEEKNF